MKALYDTDRVSVIHGEALETLKSFPDKMFDIVLTDPPYSSHVHTNLGKERRNDGIKAREELKFPPMTPERIAEFSREYVRLAKTWILSFSDFFYSGVWGQQLREAGGEWVRTGAWVKTNPMPQMTGDRPACGHEDIVIAHASPHTREWNWAGRGHAATWRGPGERGILHPNQKPEWLLQILLGQFCPPGGLVLDPFLGSGTTAVAALRAGRVKGENIIETSCQKCSLKRAAEYAPPLPEGVRVIGVEGDIDYATKAVERIRSAARS